MTYADKTTKTSNNICPSCGSKNLIYGVFELYDDCRLNICLVECMDCDCNFQQEYKLLYLETEMYLDDNTFYSSGEGLCPFCYSDKITYGDCELDEDQLVNYIVCHCENCDNIDQDGEDSNFDFQQVYGLDFIKSIILIN